MKRLFFLGLLAAANLVLPDQARATVNFDVDIMPASLLANFKADDFWVTSDIWGREKPSSFSTLPNLGAGLDIGMTPGYIGLRAGAGILLNYNIHSYMFYGTAGWYHEVKPSVFFGPHVGLTYFPSPEWWGDIPLDFESTMGYVIGLHVAAGDKISYLISVDYLGMEFDVVEPHPGVVVTKDRVDMSGILAQFGIKVQF